MRLTSDYRKSVLFVGYCEGEEFKPRGTAFLFAFDDGHYLVTAQHVALQLGDDPFYIRINCHDETARSIPFDPLSLNLRWYFHEDDNVDLAVMPIHYLLDKRVLDVKTLHCDMLADDAAISQWSIGAGDLCYAVGLFRLLVGEKRNLPVVHRGSIATMPGDEKIPVLDWKAPKSEGIRLVEGYLVELTNLKGLSGAPVFVRPSVTLSDQTAFDKHTLTTYTNTLLLLGVWISSWDVRAHDTMTDIDRGDTRLPLGMGIVVPIAKLIEILQSESAKSQRQAAAREIDARLKSSADEDEFFRKGPQLL